LKITAYGELTIPALTTALFEKNNDNRLAASNASGGIVEETVTIAPQPAIAALVNTFNDPDKDIPRNSVKTPRKLAEQAVQAGSNKA
jgi:hypothetical protein